MRFLLNVNQFGERGTETATLELGKALKSAGHQVSISYTVSDRNLSPVERLFGEEFELLEYSRLIKNRSWLKRNVDFAYFMKVDGKDGKRFPGVWNAVHAVFREYLPHGETYSYISSWLAQEMKTTISNDFPRLMRGRFAHARGCRNALKFDGVPHMIDMPPEQGIDIRQEFGISKDAFLIVRYGGMGEFDIPWVQSTLVDFLNTFSDTHFLAVNTAKFADHSRITYADKVIELGRKAALLESSDLFLHGRSIGETFGMSIVESMQMGTNVVSCALGEDRNHTVLLGEGEHLFWTRDQMTRLLTKLLFDWREHGRRRDRDLQKIGNCFRPPRVLGEYYRVLFGLPSTGK